MKLMPQFSESLSKAGQDELLFSCIQRTGYDFASYNLLPIPKEYTHADKIRDSVRLGIKVLFNILMGVFGILALCSFGYGDIMLFIIFVGGEVLSACVIIYFILTEYP